MKSLIIGMGIGQLYKKVSEELNYETYTVDMNKELNPSFTSIDQALANTSDIDVSVISLPNYLHESTARMIANHSKIILIEKPGLKTSKDWQKLVSNFPNTRFMMIKNNQWRDNIAEMKQHYKHCKNVKVVWNNKNRVPKPGTWFTNKDLAFGGVSRDLLPHLLSLMTVIDSSYKNTVWLFRKSWQKWELADLIDSDYGTVDPNGTYNVDDKVELEGSLSNKLWTFKTNWRSNSDDDVAIYFDDHRIPLGLCPEYAYKALIEEVTKNVNNNQYWLDCLDQDTWIHQQIEKL